MPALSARHCHQHPAAPARVLLTKLVSRLLNLEHLEMHSEERVLAVQRERVCDYTLPYGKQS